MKFAAMLARTLRAPLPDRLIDRTLRAFGDELASDAPVPGGGSAAAYAGAMGAALAAMVLRLAAKKDEQLGPFIAELDDLRADFMSLVDQDSAAYARVAEALKLPRASDQQKQTRQERLQASLLAASRVPLAIAKASRRLLDACERGMASASPMTASDIGVGALMAEAALRGAGLNVMINLASVKDPVPVKNLSEELDHALDGSDEQRRRILNFVESRIAR
jgi:glutamate formiminotransferase/formiminotetrahydrofolate cyclodeaminase